MNDKGFCYVLVFWYFFPCTSFLLLPELLETEKNY